MSNPTTQYSLPYEQEPLRDHDYEAPILSPEDLEKFVGHIHRNEAEGNELAWAKAVRATLYALGFDERWVYGEAYDRVLEALRNK